MTTAAEQIVPGLLRGFRRLHPDIGVLLEAGNRERVGALLDHHQVDLVLGGRPEPGWDVQVHAVRAHQLVVVAAPRARRDRAPRCRSLLPWLARQTWLLREPGSGTRATTEALLADLGLAPLTLTVGSNGAIRESASVGLGVTLVSRDAAAAELAAGRLAEMPVPGTPLHRDWYLVAHPGDLPATAAGWSPTCSGTAVFIRPDPAPLSVDISLKSELDSGRRTLNRQPKARLASWTLGAN